jgi:hypothetical protein
METTVTNKTPPRPSYLTIDHYQLRHYRYLQNTMSLAILTTTTLPVHSITKPPYWMRTRVANIPPPWTDRNRWWTHNNDMNITYTLPHHSIIMIQSLTGQALSITLQGKLIADIDMCILTRFTVWYRSVASCCSSSFVYTSAINSSSPWMKMWPWRYKSMNQVN